MKKIWKILKRKYVILFFALYFESIIIFGGYATSMGLMMLLAMILDMREEKMKEGKRGSDKVIKR